MKREYANIALIGVTNHGRTILRMIEACDKLRLRSCFDINSAAVRQVAAETGCRAPESYEALLSDPELDAVAIATPNFVHRDQAIEALRHGKHVFIEKPLAVNVCEGLEIVKTAKDAGKILQVGHNTRKRRSFRQGKRFIDAGEVGEIVSVYANMSFNFGISKDVPEWKKEKDKCQMLPMTQLGIHFVDTLQYLVGPIASVTCTQRSAVIQNKHGEKVVDSVAATLMFENGVIGAIQSDYVTPEAYQVVISGTRARITCGAETILVEKTVRGKVEVQSISASEEIDGESYLSEIREFAECLLTGNLPDVDGKVGLRNVAVVEAMARSAESGCAVKIGEVLCEV